MEFRKLALIFSTPSWWKLHEEGRIAWGLPDPLSHGEKLLSMFTTIFTATAGDAALGVLYPEDRRVREWHRGANALQWANDAYETIWRPHEEMLAENGSREPYPGRAFEAFRAHSAIVFFDGARLTACLDAEAVLANAMQFDAEAAAQGVPEDRLPSRKVASELERPLPEMYASFRLDWTHRGAPIGQPGNIALEPQMCLFNYWPESTNLAPPPEGERQGPEARSAAQAAGFVEEGFYRSARERFELFRNTQMKLGAAKMGKFQNPIFYLAVPEAVPAEPMGYLSNTDVTSIGRFTEVNLGVSDPLSEQMTGGVLEGMFLVLRREIDPATAASRGSDEASRVSDLFSMFPLSTAHRRWSEVEDRLARITDLLSYASFHARDLTNDVLSLAREVESEREQWEVQAGVWDSLLDSAAGLIAELQRELASSSRRSRSRALAFQLVNRLQLAFARMQRSIMTRADAFHRRDSEMQRDVDAASSSVAESTRDLTFRGVPGLKRLAEMPDENGSHRMISEPSERPQRLVRLQVNAAERLRQRVESQRVVAAEVLSVERWQEQERTEANQRLLTFGLAVLTVFVVFPLIIGHLDWSALHRALSRAPGAVRWTDAVAVFMHRWAVGVVLIVGCAVTLATLGIIAWVGAQSIFDRWRTDLTPMRTRLGNAWETVHTSPGGVSLLQEDARLSGELVKIREWLLSRQPQASSVDRLARLRYGIDRFLVYIELLVNRPEELPLPMALLLLRHYGASFFGAPTLGDGNDPEVLATDVEVRRALQGIGLSEEEAAQASVTAAAASGDSIERFVQTVSALLAPLCQGLTPAGPKPLSPNQPVPIGEPAVAGQEAG